MSWFLRPDRWPITPGDWLRVVDDLARAPTRALLEAFASVADAITGKDLTLRGDGSPLTLHLDAPLAALPPALSGHDLELAENGRDLVYTYSTKGDAALTGLLADLARAGIGFRDLDTSQSSLEDIFVDLVKERP